MAGQTADPAHPMRAAAEPGETDPRRASGIGESAEATLGPGRAAATPGPAMPDGTQGAGGRTDALPGDVRAPDRDVARPAMSTPLPPQHAGSGALPTAAGAGGDRTGPRVTLRDLEMDPRRGSEAGAPTARDRPGATPAPSATTLAATPVGMAVEAQLASGFIAGALDGGDGARERAVQDIATSMAGQGSGEARTGHAGPAETSQARGDLGRNAAGQAAAQVAEALRTGAAAAGRALEVTLQPEELGRLRFVFSQGDAGMTVSIQADRPEVLDMLRRNIDQFGADLARLGHGDVAFSFSGGETPDDTPREDSRRDADGQGRAPGTAGATLPPTPPTGASDTAGLDIRL